MQMQSPRLQIETARQRLERLREHVGQLPTERQAWTAEDLGDFPAALKDLLEATDVLLREDEELAEARRAWEAQRAQGLEAVLERGKKEWERTFDAIADWVFLVDAEGRILRTNRAGERFAGMALRELIGQNCCRLIHGAHHPMSDCPLQRARATRQRQTAEFQAFDGQNWLMMTVDPVIDEQGNLIGAVHVARGITGQNQVEEKIRGYQEQLRLLGSKLLLAEERERRRIATDLHDRIAQTLGLARIKLAMLEKSAADCGLSQAVGEIGELVDQTIWNARSLMYEISPPLLYEAGLEAAIGWLAEHMQERHGFVCEVADDRQPKPMTEEVRVLLYKGARELLVNVAKHARARHVKIGLRGESETVRIVIEDDGVGFDTAALAPRTGELRGFGLFSIRERLEHVGGKLWIQSVPGKGTQASLTAPLKD